MPNCPRCEGEFEAADLVRHERHTLVVVHCPDCEQLMGTYRDQVSRSR